MSRVAIVTYSEYPELNEDDRCMLPAFYQEGVPFEIVVWDDPRVDWGRYSMVVIRNTWDHVVGKVPQFLEFLHMLTDKGITLYNDIDTILWNLDKSYFSNFNALGIPHIATEYIHKDQIHQIKSILSHNGWDQAVIKPHISNRGLNLFRINTHSQADWMHQLLALLSMQGGPQLPDKWLLQPMCPEFVNGGEWTFIFIEGKLVHYLIKKIVRSSASYTNLQENELSKSLADQAIRYLKILKLDKSLYIRIDAINRDGVLLVNEIEAIDPMLFFQSNPQIALHYAQAIKQRLKTVS